MHIDRWVKGGVIVAIIMGIPGWIGMFRPAATVQQSATINQPNTAKSHADPETGGGVMAEFLAVMRFVGPIVSSGLILAAVLVAFRKQSKYSPSGLRIESAKWYCARVPKAHRDVTRDVAGMVRENALLVHAHDSVFGDVCKRHGGDGDPKTLEIDISFHLHVTATHDGWINLCGPQVGAAHYGPFGPKPVRDNQELLTRTDTLERDLMKANNSAHGWLKETETKTQELQGVKSKLESMVKERNAEIDTAAELRSQLQPGKHPTTLRLRFSGKTEKPSEIRQENIENWYTLWSASASAASEMGTLIVPEHWTIFVVFRKLVEFRELNVSFSNPGFPNWEIKAQTGRFAIISIGGPIPSGEFEVYAKH